MSKKTLKNIYMSGDHILNKKYDRIYFQSGIFDNSSFENCCFKNSDLEGVWINEARFFGCNIDDVLFYDVQAYEVSFIGCTFINSIFRGANLSNAHFDKCDFSNVIFGCDNVGSPTDLSGVTFVNNTDKQDIKFDGAEYNDKTIFFANFDPKEIASLKKIN